MPDIFTSQETKENISTDGLVVDPEKIKNEEQRRVIPHHTHNPLTAFSVYPDPDKVRFENENDKEQIILFLRQHPIVNLKWIFITILLILAPTLLPFFPVLIFLPGNFQLVAILIWYLLTTAFVIENFLDWFFNIYIVTTERIVDIDFSNLTYKHVSYADIDNVQDVSCVTGGVIRTFFSYGNVFIQTAAEVSEFDFLAVPNPDNVVKIITDYQLKREAERSRK
jgi:hypothetical protein